MKYNQNKWNEMKRRNRSTLHLISTFMQVAQRLPPHRFPRSSRVCSCEFWFHSMKRMVTKRLIIYCYQKINIDLFYSGCHQDTIWNFDLSSLLWLDKVHLSMDKQMIDEQKRIKVWTMTIILDQMCEMDKHNVCYPSISLMHQVCPSLVLGRPFDVLFFILHPSLQAPYLLMLIMLIQSAEHDASRNDYQVPIGGKQ